jgi:hypothetical protein
MIESDIAALLLADAGVTALAGDRVTPGYLVYDGTFPAIAIRRAAGSSSYTFGGGSEASTVLDVVCWGPGWAAARQLAEAARVCLDTYSGDDIAIIGVTDGADIPQPETAEYGCVLVVTVDHEEGGS